MQATTRKFTTSGRSSLPTAPLNEELEPFGWMLHDEHFSASIIGANDPMQVLATYQLYLEYVEAPPDQRRPSLMPTYPRDRLFSQRDLAFLDADEEPEEEQYREMD